MTVSKIKKVCLASATLLALTGAGLAVSSQSDNQVLAAVQTASSNGGTIPIYADAATTQNTGKLLDPSISEWQSFNRSEAQNGSVSYDLGGGQWVKAVDLSRPGSVTIKDNVPSTDTDGLVASDKKPVQIYSDAQLTQPTSTLSTGVNAWQIFRTAYDVKGHPFAYDLGNNQWAYQGDFYTSSPAIVYVPAGQLESISRTDSRISAQSSNESIAQPGYYKVWDVTGGLSGAGNGFFVRYVKLGNDQQWFAFN
ncbi:hypothetical protein JCM14202_4047 [Agrilactobacillus composti DSM 18527 = JCM 14202]|nr:hypothetical protein [Agrilactobacillus composti]GAF42049.1 hypothetical protein JCM14202_4047 [Agrilactobacillus composti DSM 18527 = JCM 14202]